LGPEDLEPGTTLQEGNLAIIVIDPGHGGTTMVGGSSPNNATGPSGAKEKDYTLDVALRVSNLLVGLGHRALLTRDSDINLALSERASIGQSTNANVFLSVHFNGSDDPTVQGTETWTHDICTSDSTLLARSVQQQLVAATGYNNRGVKTKELGVLSLNWQSPGTACCLAELSFITDPNEEARLVANENYKANIAAALAQGISDYINNSTGVPPVVPPHQPDPIPGSDA